jgi:1-acyl-sn-glycerol-3-phosphate acyltransferase
LDIDLHSESLLRDRDPHVIRQWLPVWDWFYRYYFRVKTRGWEQIPAAGQVLFVGSHNGGLATPDLFMFMSDWFRRFGTDRAVYGLTHAHVWRVFPSLAEFAAQCGAVPFYGRNAIAVLKAGHSLLVYPGGGQDVFRPHRLRDRICFQGRTGFIRLALWFSLPIVPLISWGAHDTLFVLTDCYEQVKQLHEWGLFPWVLDTDPEVFPIYFGLPWGIAFGPLLNWPLPAQIHTQVCAPITFERYGYAASRDRAYVQACYQHVVDTMQGALTQLKTDVETEQFAP